MTYTSQDGNFRLSRGNKGTLFILVREDDFKSKLEEAISAKEDDKVWGEGGEGEHAMISAKEDGQQGTWGARDWVEVWFTLIASEKINPCRGRPISHRPPPYHPV